MHWREDEKPERRGITIWPVFNKDTGYFEPSNAPFMVNYRVEDMDALLDALKAEGLEFKREDSDHGCFACVTEPEGNKLSYGSRRRANSLRHL